MQRILVATDLTVRGQRAMQRAAQLAAQHEAKLIVTHIVDGEGEDVVAGKRIRAAVSELEQQIAALSEVAELLPERQVTVGSAWRGILQVAISERAELIVMGVHRDAGMMQDLFRGTTVERVVRHSPVSVLVAKSPVEGAYRDAVIGVDFSAAAVPALQQAAKLCPLAELRLIHADDSPGFHIFQRAETRDGPESRAAKLRGRVDRLVAQAELQREVDCKVEEGLPFQVVRSQIRGESGQLLVVAAHSRSGLSRAVLGSVAEALLANPPCDLLLVRPA